MYIFEKESFWLSKGVLLVCKRTPFAPQKDSFCNAKGLLFEMRGIFTWICEGFISEMRGLFQMTSRDFSGLSEN